ncbi:MAG: hypothetical protein LLF94_00615 [Chlamydiales bacterium]|nr:hypothetical protein [Chlamydiales bacterium]
MQFGLGCAAILLYLSLLGQSLCALPLNLWPRFYVCDQALLALWQVVVLLLLILYAFVDILQMTGGYFYF